MRPIPIAQYLNQFGRPGSIQPAQGERPPQQSILLKQRVLSIPADMVARLEEAFERGRQEGLAAARADAETALAAERDQASAREAAARLAWQANEFAQFAEKFERATTELENRLAQSVARILQDVLNDEQVKQVTQALSENLLKILSKDAPPTLKITGPEALLSVLRDKLAPYSIAVEYSSADGVDVTIEAHETIIQSQLQAWIDHIQSTDG